MNCNKCYDLCFLFPEWLSPPTCWIKALWFPFNMFHGWSPLDGWKTGDRTAAARFPLHLAMLTSQHRASCNTHCHPKRRGWLTIREQKCFLMWSKPLVSTSYIDWKTWEEDLVYYLTKSDHTVSLLHQHWTFWVCEGLLYYPGHARLSSRPPAGKI